MWTYVCYVACCNWKFEDIFKLKFDISRVGRERKRNIFAAQSYFALSTLRARWRSTSWFTRPPDGTRIDIICHRRRFESLLPTKCGTLRSSTSIPTGTIGAIVSSRFNDAIISLTIGKILFFIFIVTNCNNYIYILFFHRC